MSKTLLSHNSYKRKIRKLTFTVSILWFLLLAFSLLWNIGILKESTTEIALAEARASIAKDAAIRNWASDHGGVYVPIDKNTPPNPLLKLIPNRDIVRPTGDTLTLMNPAYIIRQIYEQFPNEYGIIGHITSLKVLNPINEPDEWEKKALLEFQNGRKEISEFTNIHGEPYIRVMQPLVTTQSCLKCHEVQGYKVGDVKGAVGIAIPMKQLLSHETAEFQSIAFFHIIFLIFGFVGIGFASRRFTNYLVRQKKYESELKKHRDHLEELVKERTEALEKEISDHKKDKEALEIKSKFTDKIIQTSNAIIIGLNRNHIIKLFNSGAEKITGYKKEEVIGKDWFKIFFPPEIFEEMDRVWKDAWQKPLHSYENPIIIKSGEKRMISWYSTGMYEDPDPDKHIIISIGDDITEIIRQKEQLLLSVKRYKIQTAVLNYQTDNISEYLDFALEKALELTDSMIGYIYHYSEEKKEFIPNSWSEKVMDACEIGKNQSISKLEETGIWGEVVRQRKPILLNDFSADHPLKKGYPSEHLDLENFLSLPVFKGNSIVAVIGVANKPSDYLDDDIKQLQLFIDIVWRNVERIEAENNLKKGRDKYRNLFSKSKDAILIIENGQFIDCNEAAVKMLKYKTKEEVINTHPSELSPLYQPDGRRSEEKANEMMQIAIEKGSHRFEWYHKKADGEIFPVDVILTSMVNDDERLIIHTNWRDITEQKKKEKIQKAIFDISEEASKDEPLDEFYKSVHLIISGLMPAKNLYIAIHDTETDMLTFPYHVDEFDSPPEPKLMGKGFTEYVLRTKKSQIITMELDKKLREKGEVELIGDNSPIWIGNYLDLSSTKKGVLVVQDYKNENAFSDEDIKILQFVSQQIEKVLSKKFADQMLNESLRELAKSKKELELINKNKDRFFSIIAHDLKSPFTALLGISQMLEEEFEELTPDETKMMIKSINNATNNVYKLIENLLQWSRLQMGSIQITPKPLSAYQTAKNVKNVLSLAADSKNIDIEIDIPEEHSVYADEDCFRTILRNLTNNAIKFTNPEGKIKIYSKQNPGYIQITVEDNGVGMDEVTLGKLFSLTEKVSEVGTANETGTGLGLILCKELVEKNGGEIWVQSKRGVGSKFIFTLPDSNNITT